MHDSICHFVPYRKEYDSIHTINFVHEKSPQKYDKLKAESVYKMYYVVEGNGFIHTMGKVTSLSKGDVFFTFPSSPFCIESGDKFSYMYISYLGTRANMVMDKLTITTEKFIFRNCSEIGYLWKECIKFNSELSDMASESVILYTFSFIGERVSLIDSQGTDREEPVAIVKKYIDDNFCDSEISLTKISKEVNYNEKYISSIFKTYIKIGIIDYINTLRVQYACTLIRQGYRSIKDISYLCGFTDPNYFSKLFKKRMGASPKDYILDFQKKN